MKKLGRYNNSNTMYKLNNNSINKDNRDMFSSSRVICKDRAMNNKVKVISNSIIQCMDNKCRISTRKMLILVFMIILNLNKIIINLVSKYLKHNNIIETISSVLRLL